jgi:Protein of unknown function (DUF2934)
MDDHEALIQRIQDRAYEISQRGDAGTPHDNWMRAEQEIREQDSARGEAIEAARDAEAAALEVARRTALTHP